FFFFQAEDGIRDKLVTGVQTCALPICVRVGPPARALTGSGVLPQEVTEPRPTDGVIVLRPPTNFDAQAWWAGEDDEQRHWLWNGDRKSVGEGKGDDDGGGGGIQNPI